MITLTFLVCYTLTGKCIGAGPQQTFLSPLQCEMFAETLMAENQDKAMAPHVATYQCISWGKEL